MKANEFIANEMQAHRVIREQATRYHFDNERERFAKVLSVPAPKRARRRGWIRTLLSF